MQRRDRLNAAMQRRGIMRRDDATTQRDNAPSGSLRSPLSPNASARTRAPRATARYEGEAERPQPRAVERVRERLRREKGERLQPVGAEMVRREFAPFAVCDILLQYMTTQREIQNFIHIAVGNT